MAVYADDILLFKPIKCMEDYTSLQSDIGAIHTSITTCDHVQKETTTSPTYRLVLEW